MKINALSNPIIVILLFMMCKSAASTHRQVVTIVADDSYPPYSFIDNGEIKGIYIDFINLAAKRLAKDYQINFVAMPWKRALREVELGKAFAIIPPYIHREERPY